MVPTLLSMLFFLLTCFSFNTICSSASQVSYKDYCASIVPASDPHNFTSKLFPLGGVQSAYYTGGGRILGFNSNWKQNSFLLRTRYLRATDVVGLFKLSGSISISSTSPYYYEGNSSHDGLLYYRPHRSYGRPSVTLRLDGFWSESTGKICMVGSGTGYSKGGKALHLDAVFKLNNVFNSSNISSLVSGSLESLNTEEEESYFEPFSVLMLPQFSYKFILDSKEAKDKLFPAESDDDDAEKGLSKSRFSFCSFDVSRAIRKLHLEYSSDCNSPQNCTPLSGISGYLPSFMSLKVIDCPVVRKNQMRVLMKFENSSYEDFNTEAFDPKMTLVGEGWWDERKNSLSVVACHLLGLESSSLAGAHVGDCSVRLRLRLPSTWSIKDTLATVGHIWSNKTVKDPGYFKGINFTKDDDRRMPVRGLKYEYTQLDRVKNLCPRQKTVRNKGKRYLSPYSYNMRFDMSVRDSYKKVAWGHSSPLFVGDRFYSNGMQFYMVSEASSSNSSRVVAADKLSNSDLFNISYKISMSLLPVFALRDSNSLFSKSFEAVKISAEGVYDAGTGSLCMVGCRNLPSQNNGIPMAHSVDCEILLKFQFPPLYTSHARYIEGTIGSLRKKSDPLYFRRLGLTSAAYYREVAKRTVQRKDMEIILVLMSNTLACVFVGFQLYHVKKNPEVLPFISLIMLSFLTLNHAVPLPLVLNFDALFTRSRNTKNFVLSNVAWLETNEIVVRLITMAALLMQFRLLQLTWSARNNSDGSQKSLWVSEKEAVFVTLPLYAAGFLVTMMVKWKKINDGEWVQMTSEYQQTSCWEVLKSYGGLVLDGFLLPQILMNMFSNMRENALCFPFYLGTSLVRLLPHAYDIYRMTNYGRQYDGSYLYADPTADFYSTAWDIAIPLGGLLFAAIIYLQQRFGGSCILPYRFKSKVYEKVPMVNEAEEGEGEAEEEEEETPKI